MDYLTLKIQRRTEEAEGISSFELVSFEGEVLPPFTAGAHIDVFVAPGLTRQYSLCSDPACPTHWRIAVLREPASRGGSAGMHAIREGAELKVSLPRNQFELVPAKRTLLLAGGIGVTPILAMAHVLHAASHPFDLHYCARSERRMAFRQELASAPFGDRVQFHADDGEAHQVFDVEAVLAALDAGTHLYVCGPAGFMKHVLDTAGHLGWPEAQLHREFFSAAPIDASESKAFDVKLAKSGVTLPIPSDKTVLEVLLENNINVEYSCEAGICGSCLTRVIDGIPDHRDSFLTDAEHAANDQFTPCCSRARSPVLVLAL